MTDLVLLTAILSGKVAQIAGLGIVTVGLMAFGGIAMRLRKGVVNSLDEAADNVISKFIMPQGGGSSNVSSTQNNSNTFQNVMRNVQSGANTVIAGSVAADKVGGMLGAGADGAVSVW